jgi:hypothetical protein
MLNRNCDKRVLHTDDIALILQVHFELFVSRKTTRIPSLFKTISTPTGSIYQKQSERLTYR